MQKSILIIFSLCLMLACKKDQNLIQEKPVTITNNDTPPVANSVDVNITNVAGSMPLTLATQTYVNENLDTFTVDIFRYYISNIKLFGLDGSIFTEPESYRLISQNDTSTCKFTIQNVPFGNYIGIEFTIGVDSLRNCSGAQSGALDPINDMFWDWSQGYIFAKMEGTCSKATGGAFFHHIGGFEGQFKAIVKATPSFNNNMIEVTSSTIPKLYMKADVLEWFKNPTTIDISAYSNIAMGKKASEIAANYSDMFSVAAIEN